MPVITKRTYRQKRPKKELGYKKSNYYSQFYGDRRWDKLRDWYRREHPLCECCLREGRNVPMNEVHHLRIWRTGRTTEEKWEIFLNPDVLCSLCTDHHKKIHNYMNERQLEYVSIDEFAAYDMLVNNNYNDKPDERKEC